MKINTDNSPFIDLNRFLILIESLLLIILIGIDLIDYRFDRLDTLTWEFG